MTVPSFRIPLRFLRGSYTQLALTVIALACGVALVCAIDLTSRGVLQSFVEIIDTMAGRAALQVRTGEGGLFREEVAETVAAVAGVELAVPVVSATAFTVDESGELLTVHGVDITEDTAVRIYEARDAEGMHLEDPLVFLSRPDSVALTTTFAARRGLGLGDRIALETPTGRRSFTVRGLLEPEGVARVYGGNLVVMDLYAAEAAFTRPGFINRVDVVVEKDEDVTLVARAIAARLPPGLQVEPPAQRKADLHKVMGSLQLALRAVALLGLVVAFLIAFNRLTSVFQARVCHLGILRAVGVRTGRVWRELVKESLLLGAAGVVLGIPLGIALGYLLLPAIATTTALNYKLITPEAELPIRIGSLALAASLGMGAALLAAAIPAWRVARRPAVTTLRGYDAERGGAGPRRLWLMYVGLAAAVAASIALQSMTRSGAWGLLATGLIAVGAALSAGPLVRLAPRPLLAGLRWLAGPSSRFAAAALHHNPGRTALTAGTLGVGLACVLWVSTIAQSFERSLIAALQSMVRAQLVVTSSHVASGYVEAPVSDTLLAELKRVPGVAGVAGIRVIDWPHGRGQIAINALDPADPGNPELLQWPLLGRTVPDVHEAVARGDAVIVSSNFALNLGATVGDTIVLDTPSGPLRLLVGALTVDFASPRGTIEMSRKLYTRYWHDSQVNRVWVRVAPEADVAAVREDIARTLGRTHGLRILSSGEMVKYWAAQVRRAFAGVYVLGGMVLLVVLVGMADTLAAGVVERTRHLGAIRAVGVDRWQLGRMVLAEAAVLALLGILLAVVAGLALGVLWVKATFPYLLGWVLELHIPFRQAVLGALLTLAVCLSAALLPARYAARLNPAVALRYE